MKSQTSAQIHDGITQVIDTIAILPDPCDRLEALNHLIAVVKQRAPRERNKAAFDARQRLTGFDIAERVGSTTADVYRWAAIHAHDVGVYAPGRVTRLDLTDAVVIPSAAIEQHHG
jgi:hypothetical protein